MKLEVLLSLISEKRLRDSTLGNRGLLIASESDKGRVINSAAFRRLQQKAQVFPLEPNAAVRTRLTHSIEVSQIGRHIAQKVVEVLGGDGGNYDRLTAFVNTVETACLLHDIGNPPFGHLGESAVQEWFKGQKQMSLPDMSAFDGNPQGFRLASFLAGADSYGFNLTCSLLLSVVKYPWCIQRRPEDQKIGIFSADYKNYEKACEYVGWESGKKFPLVLLMDIADEIAYSMSDLEDGLEKKIINHDDLRRAFGKKYFQKKGLAGSVLKPIVKFKTDAINRAVAVAADAFVQNIDAVLCGQSVDLIDKNSEIGSLLKNIKQFAVERIYSDEAAEKVELAGRCVIKGLLEHFGDLLKLSADDFGVVAGGDARGVKRRGLDFQLRLFRRLPKGYCEKYKEKDRGSEILRRSHLIVDFVSGMTDDFALEMYQVLEGIRIK